MAQIDTVESPRVTDGPTYTVLLCDNALTRGGLSAGKHDLNIVVHLAS